jgi:hypothetical protein
MEFPKEFTGILKDRDSIGGWWEGDMKELSTSMTTTMLMGREKVARV